MTVIVHGRDITTDILTMSRVEIEAFHATLIDQAPVGEESTAHWQHRNSDLLEAMLSINCARQSTATHDTAIATKRTVRDTQGASDSELTEVDKEIQELTACDREALDADIDRRRNTEAFDEQMQERFYY